MKKKIKISTAIPASMSGFLKTENPHLTKASLKVFHSGETGDGRLFTKAFSDKIAATIGGTPVVARYDEEKDDFIGHANSQSVFGFVPEQPKISTEKDEDGNSWLLTEVRLFTERHDVGKIAEKIVGRSQSLELDPDSLEVDFVYDSDGEFEKIIFQDGNLIGLSVLGLDQEPAFKGSGFFTEAFEADKIEELIAKYNNIATEVVMETGGESMDREVIFQGKGFTIFREEGKIIVEDTDGKENDITAALNLNEEEEAEDLEEEVIEEDKEETIEEEEDAEDAEEAETSVEEVVKQDNEEEEELEGDEAEGEDKPEAKEEPRVEPEAAEESADTAALNNAEREELENYRRRDKLNIIKEYEEYISEEQTKHFVKNVDTFGIVELEKELSFEAMQGLKNKNESKPSFSFNLEASAGNGSDPVADAIRNLQ